MSKQQTQNQNQIDNLKIKQTDWDYFIEGVNGMSCDKMCAGYRPHVKTVDLFGNKQASDVFCRWCAK